MDAITGFKGFDKDFKCRGMQYEVGKDYEIEKGKTLKCCPQEDSEGGLHFCQYPLDIFRHYAPANSRFATVEGSGSSDTDGNDTKIAVSNLRIKAEISLKTIIEAAIKFTFERVKWTKENTTNGDSSGATSNGNRSGATSNGNRSGATSNGDSSGATSNGDYSGATSNGYSSGATSNGNRSGATSNGNRSGATSNGYSSGATSNGDYSGATSNGNRSGATSNGDYSHASAKKGNIAVAIGFEAKAKGEKGSWLTLSECFDRDDKGERNIKDVKTFFVDGKKIKADTFYRLKEGEAVKA